MKTNNSSLFDIFTSQDSVDSENISKLQCPFCNRLVIKIKQYSPYNLLNVIRYRCYCDNCKSSGPLSKSINQAIYNWNTRTGDTHEDKS